MYILSYSSNVVNWDSDNNFSSIFDMFKNFGKSNVSSEYKRLANEIINVAESNSKGALSWVEWTNSSNIADSSILKLCADLDSGDKSINDIKTNLDSASKSSSAFGATLKSVAANIAIAVSYTHLTLPTILRV